MNDDVLEFSNAIVSTHDLFARATERIQGWLHNRDQKQLDRESNLLREERHKERARIARELHDTLFQDLLGASMQLHTAVEQMPADSPNQLLLSRALRLMQRVIDEGRVAVQGLRASEIAAETLEQSLSRLRDELKPDGLPFRIFVTGKSRPLEPEIQEQMYMIAREALLNAIRHSEATSIEVEIEYLPRRLRTVVRDNGSGIDGQIMRSGRDRHWGLLGMRERAASIGAKLRIWSKPGCGTEVDIYVPSDVVEANTH